MEREKYEGDFQEHFLEQYRLYVEMADQISERRVRTNAFFTSLLTILILLISAAKAVWNFETWQGQLIIYVVLLAGIALCVAWWLLLLSYKQVNSGKYKVIHEMERNLPFACFDVEWDKLGRGEDPTKYRSMSNVEQIVPIVMLTVYGVLLICFLVSTFL